MWGAYRLCRQAGVRGVTSLVALLALSLGCLSLPGLQGLAIAADGHNTIALFWGWQFEKSISLQGLVSWFVLVWQVWVWGRKCYTRLHLLTENASVVPDVLKRLTEIERRFEELACVREQGPGCE